MPVATMPRGPTSDLGNARRTFQRPAEVQGEAFSVARQPSPTIQVRFLNWSLSSQHSAVKTILDLQSKLLPRPRLAA